MDLYSLVFLDHAKNPRNVGSLVGATHEAEEVNTSCGDSTRVELRIKPAPVGPGNYELREISHRTEGCLVAIFSASILSEKLVGKTVNKILKMTSEDLLKLLDIKLTMSRRQCAMLPLMAIQRALGSSRPLP